MKLFQILFTALILISSSTYAGIRKNSCTCLDSIEEHVNESNELMAQQYKFLHNSYLKYESRSLLLKGTIPDKAIILVHGFIASPFEVKEVGEYFNNMGYTVYMPLLYGFGSEGSIANKGKLEMWRKQVKESVNLMSTCFSQITLGGISLGGALTTDYVLNNNNAKIKNVVLLSPYYDISQSVARLLVGPISSLKESVDLSTLFSLSKSDDLVEILKNSNFYSNIMPLVTLNELFKLSDELKNLKNKKLKMPAFVAYSEFDTTIDLNLVQKLPRDYFEQVKMFGIRKDLKVPHQITYENSNPRFYEMLRSLSLFISN